MSLFFQEEINKGLYFSINMLEKLDRDLFKYF
jgi:hypothetical protein